MSAADCQRNTNKCLCTAQHPKNCEDIKRALILLSYVCRLLLWEMSVGKYITAHPHSVQGKAPDEKLKFGAKYCTEQLTANFKLLQ